MIKTARIRRMRAMRNGTINQWALVIEAQPPEWPFGETLIFSRLSAFADARLKILSSSDLVDALLRHAREDGVESHELTGNVRDIGSRRWLSIRAEWLRVGDQAGLAANRILDRKARRATS